MQISEQQIETIKEIEVGLLKAFISVCKILDLKYYVTAGTLLGTVRHQGFIPWDDDIDVAMPRADYEIFVRKAQELLPEDVFLQTRSTDPEFPMYFCKLRKNDTTFIEIPCKNLKMHHGIFIDIFPLDVYPKSKIRQRFFQFRKKLLTTKINETLYLPPNRGWKKIKKIGANILTAFISPQKAIIKRDKLFTKFKKGDLLAIHGDAWRVKEIVPKEWYAEGAELLFEGVTVVAPKEYHLWLTKIYGDYMQLPPKEQQVGHHHCTVIDLKKSYLEYV